MTKTSTMMTKLGNQGALERKDFEKIKNQVLICIGDEDKMVSIRESKEVADILPNGELKIIPGFRHPIETNDVDLLSSILLSFFHN